MKFFSKFKERFKSNKPMQIAVVLILIVVMFVIYFSSLSKKSGSDKTTTTQTAEDYATSLEIKLSSVLSQISGAGKVDAMVTVEGGPTYEIAYTTEERTTSGSSGETTIEIRTPVLITKNGTSSPVILSETNPTIVGVIIVAQGAGDMKVKMDLIRAAEAILKVPLSCIEIFVGKT